MVVARGPSGGLSPSEGGLDCNSRGCDGYETRERCSMIMVCRASMRRTQSSS